MRKRRVCEEVLDLEIDENSRSLTPEAKDLLKGMLTKDMGERLTINQVLAHPWLASAVAGEASLESTASA